MPLLSSVWHRNTTDDGSGEVPLGQAHTSLNDRSSNMKRGSQKLLEDWRRLRALLSICCSEPICLINSKTNFYLSTSSTYQIIKLFFKNFSRNIFTQLNGQCLIGCCWITHKAIDISQCFNACFTISTATVIIT